MSSRKSSFGGFRKPVKKSTIAKTGNMTLRIEGKTKEDKVKFIQRYYSLNRKGKRDLIRDQEIRRRADRKENGTFGNHEHPAVLQYSEKLLDNISVLIDLGYSYLGAIHTSNQLLKVKSDLAGYVNKD